MTSWRGGHRRNRSGQRGIILVFALLFVVLSGVAVLIAVLRQPPAAKPVCPNHQVCASPPRGGRIPPLNASSSPRLIFSQQFTSPGLGYRFEYPSQLVTANVTDTDVTLTPPVDNAALVLVFQGASSSDATPAQMLDRSISTLQSKIPDLQRDGDPSVQILSPELGYRAGVGGFYQGNFDSPTGATAPVDVAILAATDGQETLSVAVVTANRGHTQDLFRFADQLILDTLRLRGDVPQ